MATLTQTTKSNTIGVVTTTRNTLTSSDVIPFVNGAGQELELYNTTASPVIVTLTGSSSTTFTPPGYGGSITVSGGKAITVPANGTVVVKLDTMNAFLQGTVTMTNGTGVVAHLYN